MENKLVSIDARVEDFVNLINDLWSNEIIYKQTDY